MDFTPSLLGKSFFRFTGPPEHWLTAVKFMTWGLEESYRSRWENIQPGDIFFIHSTKNSEFPNAQSGIIGLGVIGSNFTIKKYPLWLYEQEHDENRWPLLVPLSEIYLFSELPAKEAWEAPAPSNRQGTKNLIDALLKNHIPLSTVRGFPQMGSFSSVSREVAEQILYDDKPLFSFGTQEEESVATAKRGTLIHVEKASETFRYASTLRVFDNIKKRVVKEEVGTYLKNNELLARAENIHGTILQNLIDIFKAKGYETRANQFVDLFAYNEKRSFLIEVKSTENNNFRSQARKGIVQLFEYDYFEVQKFIAESDVNFNEQYRVLVTSQEPKDEQYIKFTNSLDLGIATVEEGSLKAAGKDLGFSNI